MSKGLLLKGFSPLPVGSKPLDHAKRRSFRLSDRFPKPKVELLKEKEVLLPERFEPLKH